MRSHMKYKHNMTLLHGTGGRPATLDNPRRGQNSHKFNARTLADAALRLDRNEKRCMKNAMAAARKQWEAIVASADSSERMVAPLVCKIIQKHTQELLGIREFGVGYIQRKFLKELVKSTKFQNLIKRCKLLGVQELKETFLGRSRTVQITERREEVLQMIDGFHLNMCTFVPFDMGMDAYIASVVDAKKDGKAFDMVSKVQAARISSQAFRLKNRDLFPDDEEEMQDMVEEEVVVVEGSEDEASAESTSGESGSGESGSGESGSEESGSEESGEE